MMPVDAMCRASERLRGRVLSRWVGSAFFCSVGILPAVPTGRELASAPFLLLSIPMVGLVALSVLREPLSRFAWIVLGVLVLVIPLGVLNLMSRGAGFADAVRAATPLLFLGLYPALASRRWFTVRDLCRMVVLAVLAWAACLAFTSPAAVLGVLEGRVGRLTFESTHALVPLGVVGVAMCLMFNGIHAAVRVAVLVLSVSVVLLSGYRSQLLLVLLLIFAHVALSRRWSEVVPSLAMLAAIGIYAAGHNSYSGAIVSRLQSSAGDSVRLAEIRYAAHAFADDPLIGQGLGAPVSVVATRPSEAVARFATPTVPYLHNGIAYVAMNLGVIGLAAYAIVFATPMLGSVRAALSRGESATKAAWWSLAAVLCLFQVTASFRQIQMWVVVAALLAVLDGAKVARRA